MTDIRDSRDVRQNFNPNTPGTAPFTNSTQTLDRPASTQLSPVIAEQANPRFAIAPGTFHAPGIYTVRVVAAADGVWTISRAERKQNLDGTMPIIPTPFDAHERVVRGPHTHTQEEGYEPQSLSQSEPGQQYPKAVTHDPETGAPIIVNNAEEEKAYNDRNTAHDAQLRGDNPNAVTEENTYSELGAAPITQSSAVAGQEKAYNDAKTAELQRRTKRA